MAMNITGRYSCTQSRIKTRYGYDYIMFMVFTLDVARCCNLLDFGQRHYLNVNSVNTNKIDLTPLS